MWRWWPPAALAAGGAVLLAVAVSGGSQGDATSARPAPAPARAVDPLAYPREGLRMARPLGWTAERRGGVIRLRSADGRVAVAVATWRRAVGAQGARRRAEGAVQRGYRAVRVLGRRPSTLGGAPAQAVELVARGRRRALVDVLVVGGASPWRSYAVTAVSAQPRSPERLRELSALLAGVTYTRPGR